MKKNLLLIFLSIFSFLKISHAQDAQMVDSLLAIYNNQQSVDTSKVKALKDLFNAYLYYDQKKAGHYLSLVYDIAKRNNDEFEVAKYYGSKGILFDIEGQLDSSRVNYEKAIDYFEKNNKRIKLEFTRVNLAMIEHREGNLSKAINLMEKNILPPSPINSKNALSQGISYTLLSRVYRDKGFYQLALTNALTGLKIIETTEDELRIADALNDLADVESLLGNYQKSIDYQNKAIALYKKHDDKYFLANSKTNIASTYLVLKDYPKALKSAQESLQLAKEVGTNDAQSTALITLGKIYSEQGQFEIALKHFEDALEVCEQAGFAVKVNEVNLYKGSLYLKIDKYSDALSYFNKSISVADSLQQLNLLQDAYFYRASVFEKNGNYKSALEDYKNFHSVSDSIFDTKQITAIEELRTIHDLEQKEKEITLLAKNAELDQVKKTRLWISLIGAVGLGSILLWAQWSRRRKEKEIENEKRKVSELENQKLTQELDFKKQELTSKVLQLCRKNEFLQSLNKEVKEFKTDSEGSEKHRLEKLSRKINRDIDVDADWQQFLKLFETVHPDFNKMLLQKYPNLAPNEIRMACLMRMNLESKDIANLLNITPDGVKKARYRMRKKMEKDSAVNLTEYFMNFGFSQNE